MRESSSFYWNRAILNWAITAWPKTDKMLSRLNLSLIWKRFWNMMMKSGLLIICGPFDCVLLSNFWHFILDSLADVSLNLLIWLAHLHLTDRSISLADLVVQCHAFGISRQLISFVLWKFHEWSLLSNRNLPIYTRCFICNGAVLLYICPLSVRPLL